MNYLVQFLSVLEQEEIASLEQLPLYGKEKKLLEILVLYKNNGLSKDTIIEKLQMTESYFYKACSILLNKIYKFFFQQDTFELLKFLSKRDLYQNLKHEIFQNEKKFSNNLEFHLLAYELLQRGSIKNHEEEVIHYFAERVRSLIAVSNLEADRKQDILFYLEIREIRSKFFKLLALRDNEQALALKNRLLELEVDLREAHHPLAYFHFCHAFYNYEVLFGSVGQKATDWLEKALRVGQSSHNFSEEDIVITQFKIAENLYYQSFFERSFEIYYGLYQEKRKIFSEDYYHLAKFVQVCLILERWDLAEKLLDSHFLKYLQIMHPTRGTMAAIHYIKFFLLKNDLEQASVALQKALILNDKNFYLPYEFEIRLLESTLFFLKGEWDYCMVAIKKHHKYFRNKGLRAGKSDYVNYLRWIEKLARSVIQRKKWKIGAEFAAIYNTFQAGSYAVYGKLLTLCLQKNG